MSRGTTVMTEYVSREIVVGGKQQGKGHAALSKFHELYSGARVVEDYMYM
jgi:hypothetical protein